MDIYRFTASFKLKNSGHDQNLGTGSKKLRQLLRRFQVHIEGYEYKGLDIFDDATLQYYHELNPKDIFWTDLTAEEFLQGKCYNEVKELFDEKIFNEIISFLNDFI